MGWIIGIINLLFKGIGILFGVAKRDWDSAIEVTRKNIAEKEEKEYE